jgi:thiol:disulfide interchange protein DsbG
MKIKTIVKILSLSSLLILGACDETKTQNTPTDKEIVKVATTAAENSKLTDIFFSRSTSEAFGIAVGPKMSSRTVYFYVDPRCTHCTAMYQQMKLVHENLRIVWVPVAILGPESMRIASSLIGADDQVGAMDAWEMHGTAPAALTNTNQVNSEASIKANVNLFVSLLQGQKVGVPYTVFKNASGKVFTQPGEMNAEQLKSFFSQ